MTIQVPTELSDYVAGEVAHGRFSSEKEAVVEALTLLQRVEAKRALLKLDLEEGMASERLPAEQVFAELEQLSRDVKARAAAMR